MNSSATQQFNVPPYIYAVLLPAIREFGILIGQKTQLTGWDNGNEMRNVTYMDTKTSIEWPYRMSISYTVSR